MHLAKKLFAVLTMGAVLCGMCSCDALGKALAPFRDDAGEVFFQGQNYTIGAKMDASEYVMDVGDVCPPPEGRDFVVCTIDGVVHGIVFTTDAATTYEGFTCGYNIDGVESYFDDVYHDPQYPNVYKVYFKNGYNVDTDEVFANSAGNDSYVCIVFETTDDGTISKIAVYDDPFRQYLYLIPGDTGYRLGAVPSWEFFLP